MAFAGSSIGATQMLERSSYLTETRVLPSEETPTVEYPPTSFVRGRAEPEGYSTSQIWGDPERLASRATTKRLRPFGSHSTSLAPSQVFSPRVLVAPVATSTSWRK